jgi:flagellar hook-associated protein 3 FlgL
MRVSFNALSDTVIGQLGDLGSAQVRLQRQAASGQRIASADQDPLGAQRLLDSRAETEQLAQFAKNISRQRDVASVTQGSIQALQKVADRAAEIATRAVGVNASQDLSQYATEVNQLLEQALNTANAKYGDGYLLSGTNTRQAPFAATRDSSGQITGITYQGNNGSGAVDIAQGESIDVRIPGSNSTGSGTTGLLADTRTGADLFAHLISLRDHLRSGDTTAINATDSGHLIADGNHLIDQLGMNAATIARLDTATSANSSRSASVAQRTSSITDVDLAETLTDLTRTQTAYQVALQTGAKILNLSLMDYLH